MSIVCMYCGWDIENIEEGDKGGNEGERLIQFFKCPHCLNVQQI